MSGQDEALVNLKKNLAELNQLLSIEREATTELTSQLSLLETKIVNLKTNLAEAKTTSSQYQEELIGKSNIISLNQNQITDLKKLNIIRLYLIKSYRGKAHAIGKPVKGQRT
jgi:ribosomal protein S13